MLHGHRRLAIAGGFLTLAVLATVAHRGLLSVDRPLSELVRGDSLAEQFRLITTIGGTEIAIAVAVAMAAVLWRRCRTLALVYPGTLLVGAVLNIVLKAVIGRPRPPMPDTGVALASFPSGHTLQATLLLGLLPLSVAVLTPRVLVVRGTIVASVIGIVAVALSRVYLGAHWPTDVVGGVMVGAALILAAERVASNHRFHQPCDCRLALAS